MFPRAQVHGGFEGSYTNSVRSLILSSEISSDRRSSAPLPTPADSLLVKQTTDLHRSFIEADVDAVSPTPNLDKT